MTVTDPSVAGETTTAATLAAASEPIVRSLLTEAAGRYGHLGVLGIRARLQWTGAQDFVHDGRSVHVQLCRSALAVHAALTTRDPAGWLVVVTDRTDDDLGLGILSRLAYRRLRSADPWEPVKAGFAATSIDHRLVGHTRTGREIAVGLLVTTPPDGWAPAPAGTLTSDHAFAAVAALLGVVASGPVPTELDGPGVLAWSARAGADTAVANLRARAGPALADAVVGWCAGRAGRLAPLWEPLLRVGRAADLVPLGLVVAVVLASPAGSGPRALLRREVGADLPPDPVLAGWARDATDVVRGLLVSGQDEAAVSTVLARADAVLDHLDAGRHVDASDVLDRSLHDRLAALGRVLRAASLGAEGRVPPAGPDAALVPADRLAAVETAWAAVQRHVLVGRRTEARRAEAGVRLVRWLASDVSRDIPPVARHRTDDAWVDRAVATAWVGVGDEQLADGLRAVLAATRLRRDAHDREFAAALAAVNGRWGQPDAVAVEDLLARHVLPLAGEHPVLLFVADGMSVENATQITEDVVGRYDGWLEYVPDGEGNAAVSAVSVLPSVTEVSRTSLLSGTLCRGDQAQELSGFSALCRAHRVSGSLFHKRRLDSSSAGHAVAADVAAAIDDVAGTRVVACVLNMIDDSLDRSDPGGTAWTADTVKHLAPLLERARRAGRIVVLTSDHGHIVERRDGYVLPGSLSKGNRWRPANPGPPAGDGEVLVRSDRVIVPGTSAIPDASVILAVDERLRYSTLKAGYHGGAAPAEVVIPVVLLAAGPAPAGWRLAPPAAPTWWRAAATPDATAVAAPVPVARAGEPPTLFDEPVGRPVRADDLADAVLKSPVFDEQRARGRRISVSDDQVRNLLQACSHAAGGALDEVAASQVLGIAAVQLAGAIGQIQRLLNVEQYPVLTRDPERRVVVLDTALLREQFGLSE